MTDSTDSDTTRSPTPPAGGGWTSGGPAQPAPSGAAEPSPAGPEQPPVAPQPASPQPAQPPPQPPATAWRPPPSDSGRNASLFFGAILLILGAWFFLTQTLRLDLPDLDWGQLWPLILIAIGAWIVFGALRQRPR